MTHVLTPDGAHAVPVPQNLARVEVFGLIRPGDVYEMPVDELPAFVAKLRAEDRDFYEILSPKPQPGDVVTILGSYYDVRKLADDDPGRRAVIDGSHFGMDLGHERGPVVLAVLRASAFYGPSVSHADPANDGPSYVSCSGGPCPFVPLADLQPAGTTERGFWRWKSFPCAGGGLEYRRTVNHWTATLNERNA